MSDLYVSIDGKVTVAIGAQPKEALLFFPSKKSTSQIVKEERAAMRYSNKLILERFSAATER